MRRELEYAKMLALVRKLFRDGLLSDSEYLKVKNKLAEMCYDISDYSGALQVKTA